MKIVLNWGIKTSLFRFLKSIMILIDILSCKKVKSIFFYPNQPISYDIMYWITILNRYKVVKNIDKNPDIKMYWKDDTFHAPEKNSKKNDNWINLNCTDISKERISKIFKQVFGYDLQIDPTKFTGLCVHKNNLNAKHDGIIIECPIKKAEPDFIYQKLIDNKINDSMIVDIRVPVFNEDIPFVYLKYRNIQTRFLNTNDSAEIKETIEILSKKEIENLIKFCRLLHFDYGELDVLRDNKSKKIYVVDANHCPSGPPNHLSFRAKFKSLKLLAKSFDSNFDFTLKRQKKTFQQIRDTIN